MKRMDANCVKFHFYFSFTRGHSSTEKMYCYNHCKTTCFFIYLTSITIWMFFSLGLIIMYGISLNKCASVFLKFWLKGEALTGRRGLINGCTYYSPVLISLLLKLKKWLLKWQWEQVFLVSPLFKKVRGMLVWNYGLGGLDTYSECGCLFEEIQHVYKSKKAFYSIELRVQKAYYHAANHSSILMRRK